MTSMNHPNVVKLMGSCLKEPDIFLVTELMEKGDLFSILHNDNIVIEFPHKKKFAIDIVKGMAYLHSQNIIHRDLKTFNLLVTSDWIVKVADFGLAKVINDSVDAQNMTACGTTAWAAPEVLRNQTYSYRADIFSYGVCLWEICTREEPFENVTAAQVVIMVAIEKRRLSIPDSMIPEIRNLIKACWKEEPDERPAFTELMQELEDIDCGEPSSAIPWSKKEKRNRSDDSRSERRKRKD